MKSENTEETTTDEPTAIPSFYELFALYLFDEWKGVVSIAPGSPHPYITIRKKAILGDPKTGTPVISSAFVGYIEGNTVTLSVSDLDKYFNYSKTHTETRQAADPSLFEWFSRTIRHEHYLTLRDIGFLDEDGTENSTFTRLD